MSNKATLERAVEFLRELGDRKIEELQELTDQDAAFAAYMRGKKDAFDTAARYIETLIVIIGD